MMLVASAILLTPATGSGGAFHVSTGTLAIIAIVVVIGALLIIGWRAPDRSPHLDDEIERERED